LLGCWPNLKDALDALERLQVVRVLQLLLDKRDDLLRELRVRVLFFKKENKGNDKRYVQDVILAASGRRTPVERDALD